MNLTCITIDVSQDKSHIQGFIGHNKPLGKARTMKHSKQGYQQIFKLKERIEAKTGVMPLVIFEYTGIYHKSLEKFLIKSEIDYHIVSPLRAAKARNTELRYQKTDARDCLSIAQMHYNNNLGDFYTEDKVYSQLRKLNRHYETNNKHLTKIKVNFRECLSVLYPNYKTIFQNPFTDDSLVFLENYPHPDIFMSQTKEQIINTLGSKWRHRKHWVEKKINAIYSVIKDIYSGCDIDDPEVDMIFDYITQFKYYENKTKVILNQLVESSSGLPLYQLILTIPGVGKNLASRYTAELGDISRFPSYKAIIAYAGVDPMIRQSGENDGLHLKISKKGNKRFRCILYMIIQSMKRRTIKPNAVRDYYQKKTQQSRPLKPKAASMACASKLIRIIYYMHKTGSAYSYPN